MRHFFHWKKSILFSIWTIFVFIFHHSSIWDFFHFFPASASLFPTFAQWKFFPLSGIPFPSQCKPLLTINFPFHVMPEPPKKSLSHFKSKIKKHTSRILLWETSLVFFSASWGRSRKVLTFSSYQFVNLSNAYFERRIQIQPLAPCRVILI